MNNRDLDSSVLFPNLVVLLLVAFGLVSDQTPLLSVRPGDSSAQSSSEVRARLWQDPFSIDRPARAPQQLPFKEDQNILVLPVLLNGSSYPEERETRLRARYAVLAALSRAQYVPRTPDKMQFLDWPDGSRREMLPFEEFEIRYLITDGVRMSGHRESMVIEGTTPLEIQKPYEQVFVLWVNENELTRAPEPDQKLDKPYLLTRLNTLLEKILPQSPGATITIIGPTSSDQLVELADKTAIGKVPAGRRILSPRATAATPIIQMSATRDYEFDRPDTYTLQPWPIERTILTDDRLIGSLLEELDRRKVAPDDRHDIVLIGEWDSLYSRGIGRTLAAQLNLRASNSKGDISALAKRETWAKNPRYFHEFSYLRGIDGRLPSGGAETKATTEKQDSDEAAPEPAKAAGTPRSTGSTRATGESQYDYLRRLEDRLLALQADLQNGAPNRDELSSDRRGQPSEIAAIGVVGSDPYDKLLVLRALRKSFPRAVFFTTDLDAGYLDRDEREWTRNLLIVSPFGLRAADHLQGRTPPFRDSYQTALFVTCLQALGVTRVGGGLFSVVSPEGPSSTPMEPRIFEVGRTQIFDLSRPPAEPVPGVDHATYLGDSIMHPDPRGGFIGLWKSRWWASALFFTFGLFAFLLWLWCSRSAFEFRSRSGDMISIPESSRRYLLGLGFGFVWLAATVGTIAYLARYRVELGAMTGVLLLFLGPLYIWTLFRLTCVFADPNRPFSFSMLRGNFLPVVVFTGLAGFGIFQLYQGVSEVVRSPNEEPFALFEGVSIWPTNLMRVLVIGFSLHFILRTQIQLRHLKQQLAHGHDLPRPSSPACQMQRLDRNWLKWPAQFWITSRGEDQPVDPATPSAPRRGRDFYPKLEYTLWEDYCRATTLRARFPRIILFMVIYLVLFGALAAVLGSARVPARGPWSHALDFGMLWGAVLVYTYLLFYVFDATMLASVFTKRLIRFVGGESHLHECQAIHVVNELVGACSKLIYLPFSVLFMLIASRNSLFDRWDWPPVLLGIFGSGLVLIVIASIKLQDAASNAKRAALQDIDFKLADLCTTAARAMLRSSGVQKPGTAVPEVQVPPFSHAKLAPTSVSGSSHAWIVDLVSKGTKLLGETTPSTEFEAIAEHPSKAASATLHVEALADDEVVVVKPDAFGWRETELREQRRQIESFDDVSFRHWHQNPVFRAVLIPLGGFGSLQILEKVVGTLPQ